MLQGPFSPVFINFIYVLPIDFLDKSNFYRQINSQSPLVYLFYTNKALAVTRESVCVTRLKNVKIVNENSLIIYESTTYPTLRLKNLKKSL